jgi:hypothetical protein
MPSNIHIKNLNEVVIRGGIHKTSYKLIVIIFKAVVCLS